MRPWRSVVRLPLLAASLLACGGEAPDEPNPPETAVRPGSLTILTGGGQTDTAGATFSDPVTVEVLDSAGAPLPGVEVWFTEAGSNGTFPDVGPRDTTDAEGKAAFIWKPGTTAGVHGLRAGVYLEDAAHNRHLVVADTIQGAISPGSARYAVLVGPHELFLGETLDLAGVVRKVQDQFLNLVAVTSVSAEAQAPFVVNGTAVQAGGEVDTLVSVVINGVAFSYKVHARRDLRELEGATGGYVCDKAPGAATDTPDLFIRRRVATTVVDSVHYYAEEDWYYVFYRTTWVDEFSDGSEGGGSQETYRVVQEQSPGRFSWNGPDMLQTGTNPLSYEGATTFPECYEWDRDIQGPGLNRPFHLSR